MSTAAKRERLARRKIERKARRDALAKQAGDAIAAKPRYGTAKPWTLRDVDRHTEEVIGLPLSAYRAQFDPAVSRKGVLDFRHPAILGTRALFFNSNSTMALRVVDLADPHHRVLYHVLRLYLNGAGVPNLPLTDFINPDALYAFLTTSTASLDDVWRMPTARRHFGAERDALERRVELARHGVDFYLNAFEAQLVVFGRRTNVQTSDPNANAKVSTTIAHHQVEALFHLKPTRFDTYPNAVFFDFDALVSNTAQFKQRARPLERHYERLLYFVAAYASKVNSRDSFHLMFRSPYAYHAFL
jgi:hypothetical protein